MTSPLRIAVADDEPDMRDYYRKILPRLGHQVVAVAANGRELVELCRASLPDVVITDIKMPELDGIDAAAALYAERPVPVILVSAYSDPQLVERAEGDHVMGYLVKPIKQADLGPTIAVAVRRFAEFQALRAEAADLRQALANRKVIERARELLMKRSSLDEPEAFRQMQTLAAEQGRKLVEVAEQILGADEAGPPSPPVAE
jgi:response regulator NasT